MSPSIEIHRETHGLLRCPSQWIALLALCVQLLIPLLAAPSFAQSPGSTTRSQGSGTRGGTRSRSMFPSKSLSSPTLQTSSSFQSQRRPLETIRFSFDPSEDTNFDKWPDGWKRYRGVGYPSYVSAELSTQEVRFENQIRSTDQAIIKFWQAFRRPMMQLDEDYPWMAAPGVIAPGSIPFLNATKAPAILHWMPSLPPSVTNLFVNGSLKIQLDGGQFKAESPILPSTEMHQYQMSCLIRTQGLRHDTARFELSFVRDVGTEDEPEIKELMTVSSAPVQGGGRWVRSAIKMVQPPPQTTGMIARLIVERSEDGLEDIRGTVEFDEIRIDKHPQLMISGNQKFGLYSTNDPITIQSRILGLGNLDAMIHFRLIDSDKQLIEEKRLPIHPRDEDTRRRETMVKWTPQPPGAGFFQVLASIESTSVGRIAASTTIAVIDPALDGTPHGPFGWTMPRNNLDATTREYSKWLNQLGVAWVKYPCWIDSADNDTAEQTAALLVRLQDSGIETVGMLDLPPSSQIPLYGLRGRSELVAAQVFRDMGTWKPELESIMSRLTLKVRRWQLGGDRDFSFVGRPRLKETVEQISKGLQGYGQPLSVTICWPWMENQLSNEEASWQAICRSNTPSMQANELDHFLSLQEQDPKSAEGPATWILLDPIERSQYAREDRTRDLMLRMATVRSHRVEAAFVSDPFDPEFGLLDASGHPGDLLLPWRTTSRLIGNLRNVGSLKMRGGSQNIVFAGAEKAVVMFWSVEPTEEKIYFGDNIQHVDAQGRARELKTVTDVDQPHQVIRVGPVPSFIVGADPTLLAFRMSVDVEPAQFDAFLGETQNLKVFFTNPLRDSMIGSMRIQPPSAWKVSDPVRSWEALGGRSSSEAFEMTLGNTATIGSYELPVQFEIETIPPKRITVYREVKVGPDGLAVKLTTRLLPSGELRVRINMTNRGSTPQSYNALLFAPGRQYHSTFLTIGGNDTLEREIYFEDGDELIGRGMTLRAVEQDGSRVLNYTFDARR